MPKGIAFFCTI